MEQQAVHLISSQAQSTTLAIFLHSSMKKNEYVAHKGFEPLILRMRISRPGPTRRMRRIFSLQNYVILLFYPNIFILILNKIAFYLTKR